MCPLCETPVQWVRTILGEWTPCDTLPVLFVPGGRLELIRKRDFVGGCAVYDPRGHRQQAPQYAWMPHYYTCSALRRERAAWARRNAQGGCYGE